MAAAGATARSLTLDGLRGVAALLVCAGHLRAAMLVSMAEQASPSLLNKLLYLLTGLGHQAVMVFFVLSGYLVGGSVLNAGANFTWRRYGEARLSRLWTVLLPCLALTWLADMATAQIQPAVLGGAGARLWASGPQAGQYDVSAWVALGNVFFVQTLLVPVFGSNGPLWSLANEFWYYVLFPLMLLAVPGARTLGTGGWQRGAAALVCAGLLWWLPAEMLFGFVIWLMGVATFVLRQRIDLTPSLARLLRHRMSSWACALLALGALLFSNATANRNWGVPWGDLVLGLAVAIWLLPALSRERGVPESGARSLGMRAVHRLSDMSFSLYLSHFPVVVLAGALLGYPVRSQPVLSGWGVYGAVFILLIGVAWLIWHLFEQHTPRVRRWLSLL